MGVLLRNKHFIIFLFFSRQGFAYWYYVFHLKADDMLSKINPDHMSLPEIKVDKQKTC